MEQFLTSLVGNALLVHVIMAVIPLLFILPYALVVIYLEMKIAAHMQDRLAYMRTGWHGTLQPIADMLKLLQKEDTIPSAADKPLFIMAPYIVFMGTYAAFAALPFSSAFIGSNINIGIFFIVAISSLVVVGLLMAGWSSNNKWSLFGALRSAAQIVSYEIPSAFAILGVVMLAGTMSLQGLSAIQTGGIMHWMILGGTLPLMKKLIVIPLMLILFVVYYISSMAEINRTPFDIPEAESELVQGYMTEYSGMKFAIFYLAEYANLFAVSAIATVLFFGGWASPFKSLMTGPWWSLFWFISKGMLFVCLNIWLRWTLPRLRVDQLMYISWKVLTPFAFACVLALGLVLVW
jgi:NADH-quinone oxidoreductase subunit H